MTRIIEDLSVLTSIPIATLNKMASLSSDIISHSVMESLYRGENVAEIDIGIGILYIKYEGDSVKYRFTPSSQTEKKVASTVISKRSTLTDRVEESLKNKVEKTYKELL